MSGELALSGQLRPVKGVLAIALEAKRRYRQTQIVPAEAAVVEGVEVYGARWPRCRSSRTRSNSLRSDVGFRIFYQWQIGKVLLEPSLKAAWEHEYLYSVLPIMAGFAGIRPDRDLLWS
jgi:hypothetical protein